MLGVMGWSQSLCCRSQSLCKSCDYCVSPNPLGLDFGTLDLGLTIILDVSPCEQTGLQCWDLIEENNIREQDRDGQPDCDCKLINPWNIV